MQKENTLFIFNLPAYDHKTILEKLHKLHHTAYYIKETNSFLENTTLVAYLYNKSLANDIIKNINKTKIDDNIIYTMLYNQLNTKVKDKIELYNFDLKTLLEWQVDRRYEQLIISNNGNIRIFDNTWNGQIKDENCFEANKAVGSKNGLFVAVMYNAEIIVYGNKNNTLKPFQLIKIQNITDIYFQDDDFYLFVNYKDIFNYTCIINLLTGKNVLVVKCMSEKLRMFTNKSVCYLENTKCIFERKGMKSSEKKFFEDETRQHEKFIPVKDTFFDINLNVIDRIHEFNHFLAVLTDENIKTIYLYYKNEFVKKKTYPNLVDCKFYNSTERIFVVVEKKVNERSIISVESIKYDGESTFNTIKTEIISIEVADDGFVISTKDNNLLFYHRSNAYNLVKTIKKTHKTIFALNKNGKVCCVYDYDRDMIEIYDRGVILNRVSHPSCTNIEWSQSGLFCATMSVGPAQSGLVQVFDVNGNFLWKQIFNKLTHFEWRKFCETTSIKNYVMGNYDALVGSIEEEDAEFKQSNRQQLKINTDELCNEWADFLTKKRIEIEKFEMLSAK